MKNSHNRVIKKTETTVGLNYMIFLRISSGINVLIWFRR